ncbi:uncharacterized protein [Hetaerina americana]|uniref:uncharacterized protein n=1 Tax=Hetaerina americana TaxID=62018 RepID=UPI003A7F1835
MKVFAVVLLAVCAASAATVEHVVKVPHHTALVQPTPFVGPYVTPYHHVGVAPVLAKVGDGKPVVTTYTAGAYPVPGYGYPYVHSPLTYAAYPYGAPVHTMPVVPKVEKTE